MRPDYHHVILDSVPQGCRRALDVGCGLGGLTRRLRTLVPDVTGIDRDERSIRTARSHSNAGDITYVVHDFVSWPCPPSSFDLITAVACLHHMDASTALRRMHELLRPGGALAVIGLARGSTPLDFALAVPATIGAGLHALTARRVPCARAGQHTAPTCWPPAVTYEDVRRLAQRLLPGARYRRHLYWRYSLTWHKPFG